MERKVRVINHMMCKKRKNDKKKGKNAYEVLIAIFTGKEKVEKLIVKQLGNNPSAAPLLS